MVDGQFQLDWPSHGPVVEAWPDDPDPEWEAAEAEYEEVAPANASDSVFEEGGEILIISHSEGPSTEVEDGANA